MRTVFHPRAVHVRIASACNLACQHCERSLLPATKAGRRGKGTLKFSDGRNDLDLSKDMTLDTWKLVAEKLMPNTPHMEIGGLGEPTIGAIFLPVARDIVAAGKSLFFFTNGTRLDAPGVIEAVGPKPHVSVSIDAGTKDTYEKVRKGGPGDTFERLLESVSFFRKNVPDALMDSQFTAYGDNIDDLPRWVELCARLGIGRTDRGEQLLMNPADHHVTDRADQSLRFQRDRTLAAVAEARLIAEREGLWFMATLPSFSEYNPNAGVDGSDPRKLRRYADLLFGDANPCGGSGSGSGGSGSGGSGCLDPDNYITTEAGLVKKLRHVEVGDRLQGLAGSEGVVKSEPRLAAACRVVHERGAFVCSLDHAVVLQQGGIIAARNLKRGLLLASEDGNGIRVLSVDNIGERTVWHIELTGPTKCYLSGGILHHNKLQSFQSFQSFFAEARILEGPSMGYPMPAVTKDKSGPKEVIVAPREMYVDYDGSVWSCLARHKVGDVRTGDWDSIVEDNDGYQEYLANWHFGTSMDNFACKACPRRK